MTIVDFGSNMISSVGALLGPTAPTCGYVVVLLTNNSISTEGAENIISSYNTSACPLTLDLSLNNITTSPNINFGGQAMSAFSEASPEAPRSIDITMAQNPLTVVTSTMVAGIGSLLHLSVDISYPTSGMVTFPPKFTFAGFQYGHRYNSPHTLVINMDGTGAGPSVLTSLNEFLLPYVCIGVGKHNDDDDAANDYIHDPYKHSNCAGGCGPSCNLTVSLANNNISAVLSGDFAMARVTQLDLSDNGLTTFAPNAFNYSFDLTMLILRNNLLTFVPSGLQDNAPGLKSLVVTNNAIQAITSEGSRIAQSNDATDNILSCSTFSPLASGCDCSNGLHLTNHCGYVRCTPTPDGCDGGTLLNGSNCTLAPWSACVEGTEVLGREYYVRSLQQFLPITNCSTAFANVQGPGFLPAYEFSPFTATNDRMCSICSSCPAGYTTTQCSATSDTSCTKEEHMSVGDIAAIAMATFILVGVGGSVAGVLHYGKKKKERELMSVRTDLASTERQLNEEQMENERMGQAWLIEEKDVMIGTLLGVGSSGRVFEGMWG